MSGMDGGGVLRSPVLLAALFAAAAFGQDDVKARPEDVPKATLGEYFSFEQNPKSTEDKNGEAYRFGRDTVVIQASFDQGRVYRDRAAEGILELGSTQQPPYVTTRALPLREGVRLMWICEKYSRFGFVAEEQGRCTDLTLRNFGSFLRPIRTPEEATAAMGLWHHHLMVMPDTFRLMVKEIRDGKAPASLAILSDDIEEASIKEGCHEKDGYWLWHFIAGKGSRITEYKWVIDKNRRIGLFRRDLIEGTGLPLAPGSPGPQGEKGEKAYREWVAGSKFLRNILYSVQPKEAERWR